MNLLAASVAVWARKVGQNGPKFWDPPRASGIISAELLLAKFTAHDLHMGWILKAVCRCLLCDNNAVLCHKHHACWLVCHSAVVCHNAVVCMLFVVCQNKSFLGASPPASWVATSILVAISTREFKTEML